jgi:4'-phosphopantetheinyl transferase
VWGEEVDDVEVHLHKEEVSDVKMKIQAFEEDFMISTAMQGDVEGLKVPGFTSLNIDSDVMSYAQQNLTHMSKSP